MVNLSQFLIFLLLQESFGIKIELNRKTYSFCELIWFLPLYENPELLSKLNGVLSETASESKTSAFLVHLVTVTPSNMVEMSKESMYRTYSRSWTNANLKSRKHISGNLERCSLTLTTVDHLRSYKYDATFKGKAFAWYWGNWIHHSVQCVLGLIQISNVHVILGVSTNGLFKELRPADQDTLDMPPVPVYILQLNASANILTLGTTQKSKTTNLVLNENHNGIKQIQPPSKRPLFLLVWSSELQVCLPERQKHFAVIPMYDCHLEQVLPLVELSRIANFTLVLGSLQISSYKAFHGVFQMQKAISYVQISASYLLAGKFVMVGTTVKRPIYCVNERSFQDVNIMGILFQSLDYCTWVALTVMIFCVFCFLRATGNPRSRNDALFEIIMMIFQRVGRKRDICRIGFLFGLAVIEVLYLSGTTNSIIVPRGQIRPDNVLQLFKGGFKWYLGPFLKVYDRDFINSLKNDMEEALLPDLKIEGFEGNLTDLRKFWVEDTFEADFSNFKEFKRRTDQLHKQINIVHLATADSSSKFEPNVDATLGLIAVRGNNCYLVDKLYGKYNEWCYIYSQKSRELVSNLDKILYTSGIRAFWSSMKKHYRQKFALRLADEQATIMNLKDIRTAANFALLGIGLQASLVVYILETLRQSAFYFKALGYFLKKNVTSVFRYASALIAKYSGDGVMEIWRRLTTRNDKTPMKLSVRIVATTVSSHNNRFFACSE